MLTVALHGIKIHAPHGLYPQEHVLYNAFEADIDIWLPDRQPWPFADYTLMHSAVVSAFRQPGELLETFVLIIHNSIKEAIPESVKIRVAVRKLNPPMPGSVAYAQVCYETPQ